MLTSPKATVIILALVASTPAISAERETTITESTFACVNWAAWHEYGLASLTAKGAQMGKLCPLRIKAREKVVVVEEDAGAGASEIRYRGKNWFVDNQRLN